jgi:hypothetical protein
MTPVGLPEIGCQEGTLWDAYEIFLDHERSAVFACDQIRPLRPRTRSQIDGRLLKGSAPPWTVKTFDCVVTRGEMKE